MQGARHYPISDFLISEIENLLHQCNLLSSAQVEKKKWTALLYYFADITRIKSNTLKRSRRFLSFYEKTNSNYDHNVIYKLFCSRLTKSTQLFLCAPQSTFQRISRHHSARPPDNAGFLALHPSSQEKSAPLGTLFPWLGISDIDGKAVKASKRRQLSYLFLPLQADVSRTNTRMTESEAFTDIQKQAILSEKSFKTARFTYAPHNLPHKSPRNFIRH